MVVIPREDYKTRICKQFKETGFSNCSNCIKHFTNYYCNHPTVSDNYDNYPDWCCYLEISESYQLTFF